MLPACAPNPVVPTESQTWDVHKPLPPTPNAQSAVKKDPEEIDSHNWPDGEVRRRFLTGEEPPDYKESKWVWWSMGNKRFDGVYLTTYSCQGVLHCPNPDCHRPIRPNTQKDSREKQINKSTCPICHCGPLIWEECKAQSFFHKTTQNGQSVSVWGHHGTHDHARPPLGGTLTQEERNAVREQVKRNPTASAHALKTGNLTEGSVPLPEISAVMSNMDKARYEVGRARRELGLDGASKSTQMTGGLAMVKEFIGLKEELGERYIIDSQLHDSLGVFVLHSPFMEKVLKALVNDWRSPEDGLDGRHGFVTDGNHSFFRDGAILVTSCVFNRVMKKWVPIQYTILFGQDTNHYRAHFKHIFSAVTEKVKADGIRWLKEYGLNTLDYSQAQRNAHAEEYACAVSQMIPGFSQLAPQAQEAQMASLRTEAMDSELGCHFHFWNQAERIKENPAIVHPERKQDFVRILRKMTSQTTTEVEFNQKVALFKQEFPNAFNWLSWWLRPAIMNMIFPAMSTVDPAIRAQAPRTTNAAEASHSHIHHALGSHNDLLKGIKKTHLYVKDMEREYNAIIAGHFTPSGPRDNRKPKRVTFFENDGQGPDTTSALRALEPAKAGIDKFLWLPFFLLGYKWESPNSCFFDNGLELLFRSYILWPEEVRARLRDLLPNDSFLAGLLSHCERRLKLVAETKKKSTDAHNTVIRALSTQQTVTRHKIFGKWFPELDRSAHQSALMWLQPALEDGGTCSDAQGFFGIRYSAIFRCPSGHEVQRLLGANVAAVKTLRHEFVDFLFNKAGKPITLGEYFSKEVLLHPITGHDDMITVKQSCKFPECRYMASATTVTTSWPQHFTIESDMRKSSSDAPVRLMYEPEFKVVDSNNAEVKYALVGRVLHRNDHFISQILLGGTWYQYDDHKSGHSLQKLKKDPLKKRTPNEVYYVYHQSSTTSQTTQTVSQMLKTLAKFNSRDYSGTSSKPLEVPDSDSDIKMTFDDRSNVSTVPMAAGPSRNKPPVLSEAMISRSLQKPSTTSHHPLAIISCLTCGVRGGAAKEMIKCVLCKLNSHTVCVQHLLPLTYTTLTEDLDDDSGYHFVCPQCIYPPNGRWDQLMLSTFIVVDINRDSRPRKEPMYYPARVLSRNGDIVTLEWHRFISWPPKSQAIEPTFTLSTSTCFNARFAGLLERFISSENLGGILWPLELQNELNEADQKLVEERDYHGIINALKDAHPAILQIAMGERLHPITEVAKIWMKKLPASTQGHLRCFHVAEFRDQFSLPIFPAHRTMVDQYTSDVHEELQHHSRSDDISISFVSILFELVILRQYLSLDPSHDAEIYELSRILDDNDYERSSVDDTALWGRILREFSIHEQAFQSTVSNIVGTNKKLQPVAGSSSENASGWLANFHLNQHLDRAGEAELESPLDLIRILQEDGTDYVFGTINHELKDDMSLTASVNPYPAQREDSPFIPHSPQPFPLGESSGDDKMTPDPTQPSMPTSTHTKPAAQPFRIIQPASTSQVRPQPKPTLKQTQLPFTSTIAKPAEKSINVEHQAPKRQMRQVMMDQRKVDPDSRPVKRRKK